jgi:hypothetical protein
MKKHFLITISNDVDSLSGVHFVCSFFKKISEHRITLLHISRLDCNDTEKSLTEMWDHPDDKIRGQLTAGARRSIDKATTILGQSRMSIDQMMTKTVAERYGKVKDILMEGSRGLYDAIILGRRASYTMQWMFERPGDEIAQAMIKDSCFTSPLWICPEPEPGRKNVLLCVDGSESSLRAVDHVGYILSVQDQHKITLFHMENSNGTETEGIFQKASAILRSHQIADERISRKSTWGLSVPGTILSEAKSGSYGAVALGLRGQKHGLLKDFNLAGGTTSKLISKLEKSSLWCCP